MKHIYDRSDSISIFSQLSGLEEAFRACSVDPSKLQISATQTKLATATQAFEHSAQSSSEPVLTSLTRTTFRRCTTCSSASFRDQSVRPAVAAARRERCGARLAARNTAHMGHDAPAHAQSLSGVHRNDADVDGWSTLRWAARYWRSATLAHLPLLSGVRSG